ncbi:hypothetical protein Q5530_24315 [Saccharothrix sp. BKS2]|uniref:wHTH domain-containing protein n=1 Tax=Saccharothrix sp. BKS2 TaxID=3064400 RepID=UPI0039EAB4F7
MRGGDEVHNEISGVVGDGSVVQAHSIGSVNYFRSPPVPDEPTDPWMLAVARSAAWDHVRLPGEMRDRAVVVAGRLAALRPGTTSDPWHDAGLAERFAKRVGWLLRHRLRDALVLDPAEAALLALVPLLHQVLWDRAATSLHGVDPTRLEQSGAPDSDRASYEKHLRDHPRLVERALQPELPDRPDARTDIGWWLFHRWVAQRAEVVKRKSVVDLLAEVDPGPLREVLDVDRVRELLYGLRLEPQALCDPERLGGFAPHDTLYGGEPDEQRVRVPLLGLLLGVAHAATTPVVDLSDTVVRHLGIPAPVDLAHLHDTLATATWETQADGLVLKAACRHAAVIEALREQAARMDTLLHAVRRAAEKHGGLEVLGRLPVRASADQVVAARDPDGAPEFSGWSRFTLDEQRVRELLMGEQLYRDRDLAIRELYQNALDACRYQRAREQYVERTTDRRSSWEGRVTFTQGVDEHGRAYLDCVDNGVGMGEAELQGVFSRAGVRFADLTGFRDELADWRAVDPPVELYPNSRFGIGVLSYFMLADEITVTTCRTARDGTRPGRTLRATISGPGHLFQIHPVAERRTPGTTVRLYLRPGVTTSCVQVLRRVLGIAEFHTTARHGPEHEEWEPGVFHPRKRPAWKSEGLNAHGVLVPAIGGQVVWCEHGGAVLVDGLHAEPEHLHGVLAAPEPDRTFTGAVVNLTGDLVPRLSVDRTKIVDDVADRVEGLLVRGIGELDASALPSLEWVSEVAWATPRLADLAVTLGTSARTTASFPPDVNIVGETRHRPGFVPESVPNLLRPGRGDDLADHIYLWRLVANRPNRTLDTFTGLVPELTRVGPVLPAVPSDSALLAVVTTHSFMWRGPWPLSPRTVVTTAQETGATPREIALRAAALHIDCPEADRFPDSRVPEPVDIALLENSTGSLFGYGKHSNRASFGQILHGHFQLGLALPEVRRRLERYGFDIGSVDRLPESVEESDILLLSRFPGQINEGWLAEDSPVPPAQVVVVGQALDLPTDAVRERLARYGFVMLDGPIPRDHVDLVLLSWNLNAVSPWLHPDVPVPPGRLVQAASQLDISLEEVVGRLADQGFACRAPGVRRPTKDDELLLSRDLDGSAPWLEVGRPVPPYHVGLFCRLRGTSQEGAVRRLRAYGLEVAVGDPVPDLSGEQLRLLSVNFDGEDPWLGREEPVTLAHLVEAAAKFSMTLTEVVDHLRRLGVNAPDPATAIRAAIPRIPLAR